MSQTITIDPVTRLEGHGKITIQLDGKGQVEDAHSTSPKYAALRGSPRAGRSMRCPA